jgi:O-antigen ligase
MFPESPFLGYGFHADRFLLNTHAHNSFVHALLQTGAIGTIPFLLALLLAWLLLIRAGLKQFIFSQDQKSLFIQVSGMLTFLSVRSFSESTGAFFGVDWLLLGPILLFLQVVNADVTGTDAPSQQIGEYASDKRTFS